MKEEHTRRETKGNRDSLRMKKQKTKTKKKHHLFYGEAEGFGRGTNVVILDVLEKVIVVVSGKASGRRAGTEGKIGGGGMGWAGGGGQERP